MKVYVLGYQQKDEDKVEPPKRPFDHVENVDVQYCKEPEWKIMLRGLAESELRILRDMRVHVGSHYCEFSVEELPEGEFAIVCLSHPDLAPYRALGLGENRRQTGRSPFF
jgi:hypothetical protein